MVGFIEALRSRSANKDMKLLAYRVKVLDGQMNELKKAIDRLEARSDSFVDVSTLEEVRETVSKNRQSVRTLRERFERYIRHK